MDVEHGLNSDIYSTGPPLSGWTFVDYVNFCQFHWWVSYWILILTTKKPGEWCCRILTLFHGCAASYFAIRDILDSKHKFIFQAASLSDNQRNYLAFMLSYYLFDFVWMRLFGNETLLIHIHHASSILIIIKLVVSDYGGVGVSYVVTGLEVTNPYLQLRWFLRTYGYHNDFIFKAVEIWFFSMFLIVRVVGETLLFYHVKTTMKTDLLIQASMLCIYLVSLAFAWQIFVYIQKKYWGDCMDSMTHIFPFLRSRTADSQTRSTADSKNQNGGKEAKVKTRPKIFKLFSAEEPTSSKIYQTEEAIEEKSEIDN